MRLILPGSVNWMGRSFCLQGQEKITSPPPSGAAPRFTICKMNIFIYALSLPVLKQEIPLQ